MSFFGGFEKAALNLADARKAVSSFASKALNRRRMPNSSALARGLVSEEAMRYAPAHLRKAFKEDLNFVTSGATPQNPQIFMKGEPHRLLKKELQTRQVFLNKAPDTRFISAQLIEENKKAINNTLATLNKVKTPQDRELYNRIGLMHEGIERKLVKKAPPGQIPSFFSHHSPDVILQESNMIASLPKEHKSVSDAWKSVRHTTGEAQVLKGLGINYGQDRLSRHARKHLTRIINKRMGVE